VPEESEQVLETRKLMRQLEKTQKTLRLYQSDNEVCRRLEEELARQMNVHLETWGACELEVGESNLSVEGESVYETEERSDNLAFLFFRDGIRRVSFLPGIDQDELHSFLEAVIQVSLLASEEDDLVTLFWERDFRFIQHFAIDELEHEPETPRLEEQLADSTLKGEGDDEEGTAAEVVTVDDIRQPINHLPSKESQLDEEEVAELNEQLQQEEREDHLALVVDLAVELTFLEDDPEEWELLLHSLVGVLERALTEVSLARVMEVLDHAVAVCEPFRDSDQKRLDVELVKAMAEPDRVSRVLDRTKQAPHLAPPTVLTAYLTRLGALALPAIIPRLADLPHADYRRAAADAILASGAWGVQELQRYLESVGTPEPTLVPEIVHIARRHTGAESLPLLKTLLAQPDYEYRLQAARALGNYQEGAIGEIWISLLDDEDPDVRALALTALTRSGQPELAQQIAERTMAEGFDERDLDEKRRVFSAVARLGGEQGLPWFQQLLASRHHGWFASRRSRDTLVAVAHGIARVRTAAARDILMELAQTKDRAVRAACREALKEWATS